MPSKRSCLGWGIYIAALIAIGVGLEFTMPPWPRFVLQDAHLTNLAGEADLCADGKILITGILGDTREDGWVCDARRSWDTVSGRERGKLFASLANGDPAALAGHELFYSPGRRYVALVHPTGLAVADLVAEKEWPHVLSWKDARQGPRQFSPLNRLLQLKISTAGLQNPTKLKIVLEFLDHTLAGKLPIRVDKNAFDAESSGNGFDILDEEVSLPPLAPKNLSVSAVLYLLLGRRATLVVRRDFVEITTKKHEGEDEVATPIFSARGSFVAVAEGFSNVHQLHIVESAAGNNIANFPLPTDPAASYDFTPDEERLYFFASDNGRALFTIWNTRTRAIERTINEIKISDWAHDFLLAPDGRTLLVDSRSSASGGVDLFDLRTGQKKRCFDSQPPEEPLDKVRQFLFSPDSRSLVAITSGKLHIWDLAAGKRRCTIKLDDEAWPSEEFLFSADSRVLAMAYTESFFVAWSLETGERLWPSQNPTPFPGGLYCPYPRITPDHRFFVHRNEGRIDLLDPATGTPRVSVVLGEEFNVPSVKFTPDARLMLSTWQFKQNREPWLLQKWLGKWWPFPRPYGKVLVTETATGRTVLQIADVAEAGESFELSDDGTALLAVRAAQLGEPGMITVYDVPGRPSRYLVAGIPLAIGCLAMLMRWRRKRKRPSPVAPPSADLTRPL